MKCYAHEDKEAVSACAIRGRGVCDSCLMTKEHGNASRKA